MLHHINIPKIKTYNIKNENKVLTVFLVKEGHIYTHAETVTGREGKCEGSIYLIWREFKVWGIRFLLGSEN